MSRDFFKSLAQSLLLSHPLMNGDAFRHSVVYLSAHSQQDGALGFILNHPLNRFLGDTQGEFAYGALARVPLYQGGPVQPGQLMFGALSLAQPAPLLRAGLQQSAIETIALADSPNTPARAFLGYSGWSAGQLEGELISDTWIVAPPDPEPFFKLEGRELWRALVLKHAPHLAYLVDAPEDVSLN